MKSALAFFGMVVAWGVWANPVIAPDSVVVSQPRGGIVQVGYTLEQAPAVVTVDFLTNGVSIGEANFTNAEGDVNCKVQPGAHQIVWRAYKSWPDRAIKDGSFTARVTAWPLAKPPDYMVVDLTKESDAVRYYVSSNAVPGGVTAQINKSSRLVMRKIAASAKAFRHQYPIRSERTVAFTNDYYIGVFELTQGQYTALGLYNSSSYKGEDRLVYPMESVSLYTLRGAYDWPENPHRDVSASSFMGKLRALTAIDFDLPTEVEWEYAARAGALDTKYFWGDSSGNASRYCWIGEKSDKTYEVGMKEPNAWGLYDVGGNVLEHTLDRCINDSSPDSKETLPTGFYFEPYGFPRDYSSCCTTKGGKAYGGAHEIGQRNRVAANAGYAGNGFRLACPALVP